MTVIVERSPHHSIRDDGTLNIEPTTGSNDHGTGLIHQPHGDFASKTAKSLRFRRGQVLGNWPIRDPGACFPVALDPPLIIVATEKGRVKLNSRTSMLSVFKRTGPLRRLSVVKLANVTEPLMV